MELNNSRIYLGGIQINKAYLGGAILFGIEEPSSGNTWTLEQQENGITISITDITNYTMPIHLKTVDGLTIKITSLAEDGLSFGWGLDAGDNIDIITDTVTQDKPYQDEGFGLGGLSLKEPYYIIWDVKS